MCFSNMFILLHLPLRINVCFYFMSIQSNKYSFNNLSISLSQIEKRHWNWKSMFRTIYRLILIDLILNFYHLSHFFFLSHSFPTFRSVEYVTASELFWWNSDLVGYFCHIAQCHSGNWMDWHFVAIIYYTDHFISIRHSITWKIIRWKVQTVCITLNYIWLYVCNTYRLWWFKRQRKTT